MPIELKAALPSLKNLTDSELEDGLSRGGLLAAFLKSRVKRLTAPRGVGRPEGLAKSKKVIQRRGRGDGRMSLNSTNIQLAELAKTYMECQRGDCTHTEAAAVTLKVVTGHCSPKDKRRLAKLISELPSRERAKDVKNREEKPSVAEYLPIPENLSTFAAQLNFYAKKSK